MTDEARDVEITRELWRFSMELRERAIVRALGGWDPSVLARVTRRAPLGEQITTEWCPWCRGSGVVITWSKHYERVSVRLCDCYRVVVRWVSTQKPEWLRAVETNAEVQGSWHRRKPF